MSRDLSTRADFEKRMLIKNASELAESASARKRFDLIMFYTIDN